MSGAVPAAVPRTVLGGALAAALALSGCGDPGASAAREAVAAFDGMAASGLWPGFDPRDLPLAIHDGRNTYLFRHPAPPDGFRRLRGAPEAWRWEGRHEAVGANTVAEIGGVPTAVTRVERTDGPRPDSVAAVLIHEAFHAHQDARHPDWQANEAALFDYPAADAGAIQRRRLETESLRRALSAPDAVRRACWARAFARERTRRHGDLPPEIAAYERAGELREGLARYLERRALGDTSPPALPPGGFPPDAPRLRAYAVGHALATLLDRLDPAWKEGLASGRVEGLLPALEAALETPPAEAVRAAGAPRARTASRSCGVSRDEVARAIQIARADIARMRQERTARRRAFLEAPGWRIEVRPPSEAPWFPQAFDPMNLVRLADGELLHERWLRLGGEAGELEILGRPALTVPIGEHPLFEGIRAVVVTGLREAPRVERSGDTLHLEADGVTGRFAPARLEREGRIFLIHPGG